MILGSSESWQGGIFNIGAIFMPGESCKKDILILKIIFGHMKNWKRSICTPAGNLRILEELERNILTHKGDFSD